MLHCSMYCTHDRQFHIRPLDKMFDGDLNLPLKQKISLVECLTLVVTQNVVMQAIEANQL